MYKKKKKEKRRRRGKWPASIVQEIKYLFSWNKGPPVFAIQSSEILTLCKNRNCQRAGPRGPKLKLQDNLIIVGPAQTSDWQWGCA